MEVGEKYIDFHRVDRHFPIGKFIPRRNNNFDIDLFFLIIRHIGRGPCTLKMVSVLDHLNSRNYRSHMCDRF